MTTYMDADPVHRRVEIGSTWYGKRVQRTRLNTECKLMLLQHAFETPACIAVEFRTHAFNRQSRCAIERLGAKLDGILRNHRRLPNGTLRDTCCGTAKRTLLSPPCRSFNSSSIDSPAACVHSACNFRRAHIVVFELRRRRLMAGENRAIRRSAVDISGIDGNLSFRTRDS